MEPVRFAALPLLVRISSFGAVFIGWVLFAELIVDRHGLSGYLPYYRVGNLCPYDLAVIVLLGVWWVALHRQSTRR